MLESLLKLFNFLWSLTVIQIMNGFFIQILLILDSKLVN